MKPNRINYLNSANYIILFLAATLFISCSKKGGAPEPELIATKPSNLSYSPATLNLSAGTAGTSNKPIISGTLPIAYSVSTSPGNNGAITIDSEGKIKAAGTLAAGTYNVSVTAANAGGTTSFSNIFTITVTAVQEPQNLAYTPNSVTVTQGTAATSATPTITSSGTVTYTLSSSPASAAITINTQGVISATSALTAGTYLISVTAANTNGSSSFPNIYTIQVNAPGTTSVTYTNDIQAIIANNCASCHFSGGTGGISFSSYTAAKNNIDNILTRIKLAQGAPGMMPNGGTRLPQATINLIQKWKDDGLLQ